MSSKQTFLAICLFLSVCLSSRAQDRSRILEGKVVSETMDVSDVHVINTTSKKATITNAYGYFTISVKSNDTIWFSAVQYEEFHLIVDDEILNNEILTVSLKESLTELEEVVVTPYSLSGDISRDLESLDIGPVITSSTLGLPNSDVKTLTQSERKLHSAMQEQGLHKLIDEISGHNKRLRKLVSLDHEANTIRTLRRFYPDSLYTQQLKVPKEKIDDFMYFCAIDSIFDSTVKGYDQLKIWGFLEKKSTVYRRNNDLD